MGSIFCRWFDANQNTAQITTKWLIHSRGIRKNCAQFHAYCAAPITVSLVSDPAICCLVTSEKGDASAGGVAVMVVLSRLETSQWIGQFIQIER